MTALGCTLDLLASIQMQLVLELPPPAGASLTLLACCLLRCRSQPLQAAAAYLEALQTLQTPLTPQSTWEEQGGNRVPESTAYSVLNDRRREQVRGRGWRPGQPTSRVGSSLALSGSAGSFQGYAARLTLPS